MFANISRRQLLVAAVGGSVSTTSGVWSNLPAVNATEASLDPNLVQLDSGIEPLVVFLETTPRDQLIEKAAAKVKSGTSYREMLAALLLAAVRNVEPRPSVGHKFHTVLVVNSAHLASLSSPPEHRWLPIFWALDYFKEAQARDQLERGWSMSPVNESKLPPASKARTQFVAAMDHWNVSQADTAVAALARSAGANDLYELFFRYGARDFRSIGHKAIFVANSYRTLQCIGWQHAEPVVRSLAYALLMHEEGNPAERDAEADRPFRRNQELSSKIRADWLDGEREEKATEEMLAVLRTGSNDDCCDAVVELINRGTSPDSIWDALHVGAGELLMRQPAIVALHAVTTTNALYFAYTASGSNETRKLLLLQNAAFLPMFRDGMGRRGRVNESQIGRFTEAGAMPQDDSATPEAIFDLLHQNPQQASIKAFEYLQQGGSPKQLIDTARVLIFRKGSGAHDYKFSSAILEDFYHVSPNWRNAYLASNIFKLRATGERDNVLFQRINDALA